MSTSSDAKETLVFYSETKSLKYRNSSKSEDIDVR